MIEIEHNTNVDKQKKQTNKQKQLFIFGLKKTKKEQTKPEFKS